MSQPPGTPLAGSAPAREPRTNGASPGTPTATGRSAASSAVYSGATRTPVATVRLSASSTGSGSCSRPALRSTPATSSRHWSRVAASNSAASGSSSGTSCSAGTSASAFCGPSAGVSAGPLVCWSVDLIVGFPPLVDGSSGRSVSGGGPARAGGCRVGLHRVQRGAGQQPETDVDRALVDVEGAAVQVERRAAAVSAEPGQRDRHDVGEPAEVLAAHA